MYIAFNMEFARYYNNESCKHNMLATLICTLGHELAFIYIDQIKSNHG